MRRTTGLKVAAATVVAGGVAGVLVVHANQPRPLVRLVGSDPQILVINKKHVAIAGTALGGKVMYLPREKCFVLDDTMFMPPSARPPARDSPTPVPTTSGGVHGMIWPFASTPVQQGTRRGVDIPGIGTIWDGDRIEGGGEHGPMDEAKRAPSVPASCLGYSVYEFVDVDPPQAAPS